MEKEQSPANIEMDLNADIQISQGQGQGQGQGPAPAPEALNIGFMEESLQNQTQIIPQARPAENESTRISMYEAPPLPPADMAIEDISEIVAVNQSDLQGNMASVGNQNVSEIASTNQQGNISVIEPFVENGSHFMDNEAIQGGRRKKPRSYRKKRNQKQRRSRKFRNTSYRRRKQS